MKFMKLGSKPDTFQTAEDKIRYVVSELATDIVVQVGDVKFYLHKFPLLSKSARLQKLLSTSSEDKIVLYDIPGGPAAFETCAKFCYGMTVTLNAYNVVPTRCAAEYLEMHETVDKGNLVYKLDVFLSSSIFRSWKDSIIVLQSSKPLSPLSEELEIVTHCVDAIAVKASTDVSKVDWSYTYSRRKTIEEENGNGLRVRAVPLDWWAEDLSELEIDLYKRVIVNIKNKGLVPSEVIGEALKAYAYRKLPGSGKNVVPNDDLPKFRSILETVVSLLPSEKGCVSCSFLLKLLKAAVSADSDPRVKKEIVRRVGEQLEEASVGDLLIPACEGSELMYDVEIVRKILEESVMQDRNLEIEEEIGRPGGILSDASKLMVAKLVDGYLLEIAKDRNLPLSTFVGIVEIVSGFSNPVHDGMYRAIDTYLKEHPGISKSERKRICRLMDCKKLSANACMHAVQNERLPLRVVVQVLFFEQVRAAAAASSGGSTPDLPKAIRDLNCYNHSHGGSSRSATTNTEEEWGDAMASAEELRGEVAGLRLANGGPSERDAGRDRGPIGKVKGLIMSKRIASKIWLRKGGVGGSHGDNSGSDSSESLGSSNNNNNNHTYNHHEDKRGRHSVS